MLKSSNLVALFSFASLVGACGAAPEAEDGTDQLNEAAMSNANSYYVVTRQDYRKCAYPMCGGYFVKRLNHTKTKCADGSLEVECHVVDLDLEAVGLTEDEAYAFESTYGQGLGLVRGDLDTIGKADTLVATEAWIGAASSEPSGTFYRVQDTGVKCIAAPCPSFRELKLNSSVKNSLAEVDLAASGADEKQVDAGWEELFASDILVAGVHETVTGPAGKAKRLVATEFYTRVTHRQGGVGSTCGGFAGLGCDEGLECADDPNDSCDVAQGGADCGGICVAADPCGGCGAGEYCSYCWGSSQCIPEGALC